MKTVTSGTEPSNAQDVLAARSPGPEFGLTNAPLLFLDYDGVLHPSEVYVDREGAAYLKEPGELFMWAPILVDLLAPYPEVRIVLSTSWARHYGGGVAAARLPEPLRLRVVGSTEHQWPMERGREVANFIAVNGIQEHHWLALDDNPWGWESSPRGALILCHPSVGLSRDETQEQVAERLQQLISCWRAS